MRDNIKKKALRAEGNAQGGSARGRRGRVIIIAAGSARSVVPGSPETVRRYRPAAGC